MEHHQSMSSRATTSQNDGSSASTAKTKIKVGLSLTGKPQDPNANKFSTRAGDIIRRHIPINIEDWRNVPDSFKDDIWHYLMLEFEFPVNHVRSIIETGFPPLFRRYKYDLRSVILGENRRKKPKKISGVAGEGEVGEVLRGRRPIELTPEEWEAAKLRVPDGMDKHIWEEFVELERNPKQIERCTKNAEYRSMQTIRHTLGRCSYSNKQYKLDEESNAKAVPKATTDKWLMGHQRPDGSVHPSAIEAHRHFSYENVEESVRS
ncbi:hypothetical protein MKW94_005993 [Papaver nudicaule]|uniref:Transposase n=1 Tax=Papaver nudicaule TaxID=74823 RepID=A0AA41V524_PAPNU|nr:hypothetical protein [Papaver nudicaule]